jgi:hypothetical protein
MLNIQELSGNLNFFLSVNEEVETRKNELKRTFQEIRVAISKYRNFQVTDCRPKEGREKKVECDCFTRSFLGIQELS